MYAAAPIDRTLARPASPDSGRADGPSLRFTHHALKRARERGVPIGAARSLAAGDAPFDFPLGREGRRLRIGPVVLREGRVWAGAVVAVEDEVVVVITVLRPRRIPRLVAA